MSELIEHLEAVFGEELVESRRKETMYLRFLEEIKNDGGEKR